MTDVLLHCLLKNKELSEDFAGGGGGGGGTVGGDRMTDLPEGEEGWRAYYEHPLTAATTAMLNINGTGAGDDHHNGNGNGTAQGGGTGGGTANSNAGQGVGLLYEFYKLPPLDKNDKVLADKYGALPEIWSSAVTSAVVSQQRSTGGSASKPVIVGGASAEQQGLVVAGRGSETGTGEVAGVLVAPSDVVDLYLNRSNLKRDEDGRQLLTNGQPGSGHCSPHQNPSSPDDAVVVVSKQSSVIISPDPSSTPASPSSILPVQVVIKQESSSPLVSSSPSPVPLVGSPGDRSELILGSPSHTPVDLVAVTAPLPPTAVAVTGSPVAGSPDSGKSDMQGSGAHGTVISLSAAATQPFPAQVFANTYETLGMAQYGVLTNAVAVAAGTPPQYGSQTSISNGTRTVPSSVYTLSSSDYYRDYYSPSTTPTDQYQTVRQHLYGADGTTAAAAAAVAAADSVAFVDRYIRQNGGAATYKANLHGLSVDLPSPDSGIGEATITPRDSAGLSQIFDYSELSQTQPLLQAGTGETGTGATGANAGRTSSGGSSSSSSSRRSWHEFGRNSESDKVQIPKLHSEVGFKYYLESPISTSQRREDDRITYINKGQFYGITLEYLPDPDKPLKTPTVKTVVMLVFREEKSQEDEIKAWQFWHSRQHSVKQRILDADTKNSSGIIGQIEEITHNAIALYWNPMESPAKINVAVQCLSTDFSNQKGVKGLPLHLQVDTFDDYREGSTPVHRGYCQIKVFCDKGAERKTRDEERRAAKRKLTATGSGRKKIEEMYHVSCDRSEFYSMCDLMKPPVLFTPSEDLEKQMAGMELAFYNHSTEENGLERREKLETSANELPPFSQPPATKRLKVYPNDRVLLYAKRENEDVFHPLHLVPPTLAGLANAIEDKYKIGANSISNLFKRCSKGITVQMDDDIVKHYCNEDTFILEIVKTEDGLYDVTMVEL